MHVAKAAAVEASVADVARECSLMNFSFKTFLIRDGALWQPVAAAEPFSDEAGRTAHRVLRCGNRARYARYGGCCHWRAAQAGLRRLHCRRNISWEISVSCSKSRSTSISGIISKRDRWNGRICAREGLRELADLLIRPVHMRTQPLVSAIQPEGLCKIRVVVRKRPLTSKENKNGDIDVLDVRTSNSLVVQEIK